MQIDAPADIEKYPALHAVQLDGPPLPVDIVPVAQLEHTESPLAEYMPAKQLMHVENGVLDVLPVAQLEQVGSPLAV